MCAPARQRRPASADLHMRRARKAANGVGAWHRHGNPAEWYATMARDPRSARGRREATRPGINAATSMVGSSRFTRGGFHNFHQWLAKVARLLTQLERARENLGSAPARIQPTLGRVWAKLVDIARAAFGPNGPMSSAPGPPKWLNSCQQRVRRQEGRGVAVAGHVQRGGVYDPRGALEGVR